METRNIKIVTDKEIVLEVNHPQFGWIPYTAVANSGEEQMEAIWQSVCNLPLEYDVDILKIRYIGDCIRAANNVVSAFKSNYSATEQSLWSVKRVEAEKVLAGGTSTMLDIEASLKNVDVVVLANSIVENNNTYNNTVVAMEAIKSNINSAFATANTLEELNYLNDTFLATIADYVNE